MSRPNLPEALFNSVPWNSEPHAIWLGASMVLRRNLANYLFPAKLGKAEMEQVVTHLKGSLKQGTFFSDKELSNTEKDLIFEHFLMMRTLPEAPNGMGLVIDDQAQFFALINGDDHLELHALSAKPDWGDRWRFLTHLDDEINKENPFAFLPKFGFLTADPSQCGTGLSVDLFLHLPALIHTQQIDAALASAEEDELFFNGITGSVDEPVGDLMVIENNYSLGMNEEAILHALQTSASKLVAAEQAMRQQLKKEERMDIKDLVSKAYGLIVHSYQLEAKDALSLLSLMKLGLELGYITGISDPKLNHLFFGCRRGHLAHYYPGIQDPQELMHKRAEFLQKELQGMALSDKMH